MSSAPARRFGMAHVVGAVVVIGVASILITLNLTQERQAAVDTARAWAIEGPPCPALSQAAFVAKGYKVRNSFDYDGVTIGRSAGHASCSDVKSGGGKGFSTDKVCQFTAPAALTVTTKAGAFFYAPGIGQPASIIIHHDQPRCVVASHFTMTGA